MDFHFHSRLLAFSFIPVFVTQAFFSSSFGDKATERKQRDRRLIGIYITEMDRWEKFQETYCILNTSVCFFPFFFFFQNSFDATRCDSIKYNTIVDDVLDLQDRGFKYRILMKMQKKKKMMMIT